MLKHIRRSDWALGKRVPAAADFAPPTRERTPLLPNPDGLIAHPRPTMPAPTSLQRALLTAANVLIPVAVLTFAVGFFPYKPFLPGLAEYGPSVYGSPPDAPFDKVVFMVVDALRRCAAWDPWPGKRLLICAVISSSPTPPASTLPKGMLAATSNLDVC